MQVFATGFVPYVGKVLNFLLLSWMYAYYCFEYVVLVICFSICYTHIWPDNTKLLNLLDTNGTFLKWLSTKGWTSLNLTGHFLLVLVIHFSVESIAELDLLKHTC
jgi:hypothetical protein